MKDIYDDDDIDGDSDRESNKTYYDDSDVLLSCEESDEDGNMSTRVLRLQN